MTTKQKPITKEVQAQVEKILDKLPTEDLIKLLDRLERRLQNRGVKL